MASIKVHAGDWDETTAQFSFGNIVFPNKANVFKPETLHAATAFKTIEVATEESVKRIGGTVGWGVAGLVVLGPLGMLAGLLLGGKGKEVTFVATFNDGRKMLATCDSKTYTKLSALVF